MFELGHKHGNHNNHYKGGRLTKEQMIALAGLVPKSIEVWKKILEFPVTLKGASVQSETAAKVMSKFVADLVELKEEHGINDGFAELLTDITSRISGQSIVGITGQTDTGKAGSVQS